MEENITDSGKTESKMEKVYFIVPKKVIGKKEFGMKEKE
jgi:hypothetical protein